MESAAQVNVMYPQNKWTDFIIKFTLLLGSTLTVMATQSILPSLPQIALAFQGTQNAEFLVKLLLTIPALFTAIAAPISGLIVDKTGRKPILITSLLLYILTGTAGYYLESLTLLLISRAFLGITAAGVMIAVVTLIGDYYEGKKLDQMMGAQSAFAAFGGVVFISGGGLLAEINWHAPFLIYLIPLLILPGAFFAIYEPTIEPKDPQTNDDSTSSLKMKPILALYLLAFIWMSIFYILPVQIPFSLRALNISVSQVGFAIAAMVLLQALVSLSYQKVHQYLGFDAIYSILFSIMGVGFFIIIFAQTYFSIIIGMLIVGTGNGLFIPNATIQLMQMTQLAIRGRIVGGMIIAIFIAQFSSPILAEPIKQIGISVLYGSASILLLGIALFYFSKIIKKTL